MKALTFFVILVVSICVAFSAFGDVFLYKAPDYSKLKTYHVKPLQAPPVAGYGLIAFTWILEKSPLSSFILKMSTWASNVPEITYFAQHIQKTEDNLPPVFYPSVPPSIETSQKAEAASKDFSFESFSNSSSQRRKVSPTDFKYTTIDDFAAAYRAKTITPTEVAQNIIRFIKSSNDKLNSFLEYHEDRILEQAKASTERFKQGKPLGIFDGIPFAVKDEMYVDGHHARGGTIIIDETTKEQATIVTKMKKTGAVLIGTTIMQEIGIDVYGHNVHHGIVRSAYNLSYYSGGSSSGSANSVGSGIVPISIGLDGGGSIRIPASFNGVVGLKATFGRISEHGAVPLCWSVSHAGPIATSVRDVALGYLVMAGKDNHDQFSLIQPPAHLAKFDDLDLKDLKIGIYKEYNEDAHPSLVKAAKDATELLRKRGAQIVEIEIPHLEAIAKSHTLTILSEMATLVDKYLITNREDFSYSARVALAVGKSARATEFVSAQQIRAWGLRMLSNIYKDIDIILTPATGIPPPPVLDENIAFGFTNAAMTSRVMKYVFLGNFLGNPAVSLPIAYNEDNLPLCVQLMGRNWEEDVILRAANAIEQDVARRRPEVFHNPLEKS